MSVYGLHFYQFPSLWFTYSAVLYVQDFPVFGSHIQQICMSRGEKKKFLQRKFIVGKIFPQMLCLGREPKKTEHLGPKNIPNGSRESKSRDPLGKFFFPRCFVFLGSRPKQSIWDEKISPVDL